MAHWDWTLDIKDDWRAARDNKITMYELAQRIAVKLEDATTFYERWGWILQFKSLPEDVDGDGFDVLWDRFYDWADDMRIWVKAF